MKGNQSEGLLTPILIAGCLIVMVSFAIRSSFGLFQIPIADQFGWLRSEFSMAIAIQNLAWGIGQPIFGAIAENSVIKKRSFLALLSMHWGWCFRVSRPLHWSTRRWNF
jgi:sugar phosphate permease